LNRIIDLHTHSTASDGKLSPGRLAALAAEHNISSMALTDHDSTDGVDEFISECLKNGVEPIAGVELSTKYRTELHIVGLMLDYKNEEFQSQLYELRNSRMERNKKMLKLLTDNGFELTEKDITSQKEGGTLENTGRGHIARAMVEKGYVANTDEAFEKYLAKGAAYYVPRKSFTPEEGIELIKNAGGISILAHPVFISQDKDELSELLVRLKKAGLDGMECYYSEHTPEFKDICLDLCRQFDLLPGGGSDFHADDRPQRVLGKCCGGIDIPYSILEQMKNQKGII